MKLHWSPRSPYVRKVMICAIELGLESQIEKVRSVAAMKKPNPTLMIDNPLSKIPALVTDEGDPIVDSYVICEYLSLQANDQKLFPADPAQRIRMLHLHALANGFLDNLILWRNETNKTEAQQVPELLSAFAVKNDATLDRFEEMASGLAPNQFHLSQITLWVALAYADFRFAHIEWKKNYPKLAAWHISVEGRPSVAATAFVDS